MKDKEVFDVTKIDTGKLASAYGLINAPQIKIVSKTEKADDSDEETKEPGKALKGADRIAKLRE